MSGEAPEALIDDWGARTLCNSTNNAFGGPDVDQLLEAPIYLHTNPDGLDEIDIKPTPPDRVGPNSRACSR